MALATEEAAALECINGNDALLDAKDKEILLQLVKVGQSHIFRNWPPPGVEDEGKRRIVAQIRKLDEASPGGLIAYVTRGKRLLQDSRDGVNPLDGFVPSVPSGVTVSYGTEEYRNLESQGFKAAGKSAFVLVAGGLGERLGYSGIKVALPSESARGTSFLQLYIESILAIQSAARQQGDTNCVLPFVIMTSDDTHTRTVKYLEENQYFGMEHNQIVFLKQEKVPCLSDNEAHLAMSDPYTIQTKPHGHGDVHSLLHASSLLPKWLDNGIEWVHFIQDTNALVFHGQLVALGVSVSRDYDMNSLTVPRKGKEALGGIAKMKRESDGAEMTLSVEYNQLDPLLRNTGYPDGDVNDETGYSPFPGNINQLIMKLGAYIEQLAKTGGVIAEFVNPKYKDDTRMEFKSSTRLECMMQDYPKLLGSEANVGFTVINEVWSTYSPVKNSPETARQKVVANCPPHSANAGECHIYERNCRTLMQLGASVGPHTERVFNGLNTDLYPGIVWSPFFASTFEELKAKIDCSKLKVSSRSALVLDGSDIRIDGLVLDGSLVIKAAPGVSVQIKDAEVSNKGWEWVALAEGESAPEELVIRGFKVVKRETKVLEFSEPGVYTFP